MMKKGMRTLVINSIVIKKGLKIVTKRYTLSREKLLRDATLPVPKNATLTKNINMSVVRTSLIWRERVAGEHLTCPLPNFRLHSYTRRSTSSHRETVEQKQK